MIKVLQSGSGLKVEMISPNNYLVWSPSSRIWVAPKLIYSRDPQDIKFVRTKEVGKAIAAQSSFGLIAMMVFWLSEGYEEMISAYPDLLGWIIFSTALILGMVELTKSRVSRILSAQDSNLVLDYESIEKLKRRHTSKNDDQLTMILNDYKYSAEAKAAVNELLNERSQLINVKIKEDETEIIGGWNFDGKDMHEDDKCKRIRWLANNCLKKIAKDQSGWETLMQDPEDGRYWELTYPQSEMHGGGPQALILISLDDAKTKYSIN